MASAGTIDIRIDSLAELFNPLDPSPLHARALGPDAERYLVSCAGTRAAGAPLRLLIHCPASLRLHGAEMADGIHEHFRRTHEGGERQFRRRLRIGAVSLAGGLIVLALSVGLRGLLGDSEGRGLGAGVAEGLAILGWVAMWRPIEILLYEHWESHLDHAVLDRLAHVSVDYACPPGTVARV